jgi:hypothetical protein
MMEVTERILYEELLWPRTTDHGAFVSHRSERWAQLIRVERCGLVVLFKLRLLSYITEKIYVDVPYLSEEYLPGAWFAHTGLKLPEGVVS